MVEVLERAPLKLETKLRCNLCGKTRRESGEDLVQPADPLLQSQGFAWHQSCRDGTAKKSA